jgi:viroplasmin and RNaseH domain-containing protein
VFLSWEETEPLVKGFSGAVHHRFDSLEEAEAFLLEDYDLGRIPEPSISVEEAERVRAINAQRKARRPDSSSASSYRGARMTQADLA